MLKRLENFIQLWDLINFMPKKGRFTWTNKRVGVTNISARLDRFLVQRSFLEKKSFSSSIIMKLTSDHKPILLQFEEEEDLGPIPFRFIPLWVDCEGFMNIVSRSWSLPVTISLNFALEHKLKFTKIALKEWVKQTLKFPSTNII